MTSQQGILVAQVLSAIMTQSISRDSALTTLSNELAGCLERQLASVWQIIAFCAFTKGLSRIPIPATAHIMTTHTLTPILKRSFLLMGE